MLWGLITNIYYERHKLEKVVKVSLIWGRVEKVGILESLLLEKVPDVGQKTGVPAWSLRGVVLTRDLLGLIKVYDCQHTISPPTNLSTASTETEPCAIYRSNAEPPRFKTMT
jgi:hypothetical protein